MTRIERWWAAAILFLNGWMYALPITEQPLMILFRPVQVVHGVFLYEFLLICYLAFLFLSRAGRLNIYSHAGVQVALLMGLLGFLGIVSSFANFRPLKEFAAAGRYFLLAAYFLSAVMWARKYAPTFVLRNFLIGIAGGGAVNLFYTFRTQTMKLAGLPFLLGEQGPGGYLGISVILSAWLMMERRSRRDLIVALTAAAVAVFCVSISFSKLAMLMAGAGGGAWLFVTYRHWTLPGRKRWYAVAALALIAALWTHADAVGRYVSGAKTFFDYKFKYVDAESISTRGQYFRITAEILLNHPLFGVGYGGFYEAEQETEAYRDPRSAKEDPEAGARGESNPHSSLLYYTSANGFPGLLCVVAIYLSAVQAFGRALFHRRLAGKVLFASLAFGYAIFGLTLPTLFNSSVLYLAVAVAVTVRSGRRLPFAVVHRSRGLQPSMAAR